MPSGSPLSIEVEGTTCWRRGVSHQTESNRKNPDPPPPPEGCGLCSDGSAWTDVSKGLNQAEPFISYAEAYVQCLGDHALDAVD